MKYCKNLSIKACAERLRRYDMRMSLTKDDLKSIKNLIVSSIHDEVPKVVQPMLDDLQQGTIRAFDANQKQIYDMQDDISEIKTDMSEVKHDIKNIKIVVRHLDVRGTLKA